MKDIEKQLLKDFQGERKFLLKKRIFSSVESYKRKKRLKRFSWAASFVLALGIGGYVFYSQEQAFDNEIYVDALENVKVDTTKNVSLVLADQTLSVAEKDSVISYTGKNNEILVGDSKVKEDKVALNTLVVPYGRRTKLQLIDGTNVWLNAGSRLVYPSVFKGKKRIVYLEGEAAFDVAHDKEHPFIVMAKDQEIEVLGTVFNVSSYKDEPFIKTALKSGSVKISYQAGDYISHKESVTIKPGEIASYSRSEASMNTAKGNVDNHFLWRDGLIVFKNDEFEYIVTRLSRYYNVPVKLQNTAREHQTFSGYLDLKNTVEEVLDVIKESSSFTYKKEENEILIE
ncbi:FecR family protein [Pustulibacterium marinum]|uniref:FecR family protein n=1 Tax=Pustulibacterium marinum TaxID=1224947 RepID=A0A1I7I2H4_9FLAO|nr:FecR domain-containing protein [Pustulibacterium marinum]SFU67121.1 FecR family protein [Pustulibacterium marinum]